MQKFIQKYSTKIFFVDNKMKKKRVTKPAEYRAKGFSQTKNFLKRGWPNQLNSAQKVFQQNGMRVDKPAEQCAKNFFEEKKEGGQTSFFTI